MVETGKVQMLIPIDGVIPDRWTGSYDGDHITYRETFSQIEPGVLERTKDFLRAVAGSAAVLTELDNGFEVTFEDRRIGLLAIAGEMIMQLEVLGAATPGTLVEIQRLLMDRLTPEPAIPVQAGWPLTRRDRLDQHRPPR